MVPIIERASYTSQLRENDKVDKFYSLLFSEAIGLKESDDFSEIIDSILNNSEEKFRTIYETLSEREPSATAPFANDNYLLFLLIVGCSKFNLSYDWVSSVLDITTPATSESKLISTTYKNLINGNFKSKSNDFGIVISFENLLDKKLTSWEEKKTFYQDIASKRFPLYSDDLLNLLALNAYDSVIMEGDEAKDSKFNELAIFESKFISKVNSYSLYLQWMSVICVLGILVYLYSSKPVFEKLIDSNIKFVAPLGVGGMVATYFFRGKLRSQFRLLLYALFGYDYEQKEN